MNKINDTFPIIIPEGKYKGMRLYLEDEYGAEHILPVEMHYLFLNAFKNNYKVFFLNCVPSHNITIPTIDLNFLNTPINTEEDFLKHSFSENVLKIKKLQHEDILKLYKLSIDNKQIDAFFLHPYLKNNFYCFDIFLIVNQNFDLNELLNYNFNLIRINSVIQYNSSTLTLDILKKFYDLLNMQFKDYFISYNDMKKTRPYDVFELQEKKDLSSAYKDFSEMNRNYPNLNLSEFREKINFLEKKLWDKEVELNDKKLYIKLFSEKLCTQIFIFNEIIVSDTIFFTNFIQISNGLSVNFENNAVTVDYNELQHYSLLDMYTYDQYQLYSVFHTVYQWKKKY